MKKQDAILTIDNSLEALNDALKQGRNEIIDQYLTATASFHRYSFRNVAMIYSQFPEATFVAGYNAWKKRGRWVKPGESGIAIFAPMASRKSDHSASDQKGDEAQTDSESENVFGFRVVYVFDVSQTDGDPVIEPAPILGEPGHNLDVLIDIYRELEIKITFTQLPETVHGYSLGGEVRINDDLDDQEAFRVLVHELAHELMHKEAVFYRSTMKPLVETEAEAVAFVVSTACGIDHLDRSADYIALHQGDSKLLGESLTRIHETASRILALIEQRIGDREYERHLVHAA
ncbi:ArdC family protein [Novipirellula rosea]|uniref:N-terminal domain-containing protein n=1 Tax=Novipirellula rosea TaxID=1031540 RepID=A0ABP8NM15_9BACT